MCSIVCDFGIFYVNSIGVLLLVNSAAHAIAPGSRDLGFFSKETCLMLRAALWFVWFFNFFGVKSIMRESDTVQMGPNEKETLADLAQHKCGEASFVIINNYCWDCLKFLVQMCVHSQRTSGL